MREEKVAGRFYPAAREKLEEEVRRYLGEGVGGGESVCGGIVPHAGFPFSGKLAGEVISMFPEKRNFILLGVNHSGLNGVCFSKEDFKTPLGIVRNNKELTGDIFKKLEDSEDLNVEINEEAHKREHSLEVVLPFIQLSQKSFKIVPILLNNLSFEECCKVAEKLSIFVSKEVGIIVSSDFTHYGLNYGFTPFNKDIKENLYKLDSSIIGKILSKKPSKLYRKVGKSTVCGRDGLTVITKIAELNNWKAKKVGYYTSGDVTNNWRNVVGYGGVVFSY